MLYEMACQAAWERRIVYFKITRGKVDFLFCRRKPDEQIVSMKYFLCNHKCYYQNRLNNVYCFCIYIFFPVLDIKPFQDFN